MKNAVPWEEVVRQRLEKLTPEERAALDAKAEQKKREHRAALGLPPEAPEKTA